MTVSWTATIGDERPMRYRSYWMALPAGTVAVGFYGAAESADDPDSPMCKVMWRFVADQCPVDPAPTHFAEIDVPAHPGEEADRG